jgi:hypothetical protein
MSSDAGSNDEQKITITLKGTAGSDAPWIEVHAGSFDEALDMFQGDANGLASLMDRVQSAGKHFNDDRII